MNNRTKIKRNFLVGIVSEIVTILFGIFVPRLTIVSYGSEINGMLSSVNQIFSYIALLEAGVGVATIQALYNSLGQKDNAKTNSIISATSVVYKQTGFLFIIATIAFCIVYPLVVESNVPVHITVLVILLNASVSIISFFAHGKYLLLLRADGRNFVISGVTMFVNIFKNISRIVLMILGANIIFVQFSAFLLGVIQMIYISVYTKKTYSWINCKSTPDYKAISQSKNVLVHRISDLIYNGTDTVVLSIFVGLKSVSIYSLYSLLLSMVSTLIGTILSSIKFSLGHLYNRNFEKFKEMYDVYEFFSITLTFALFSVAYFFILPFIKLYTAGVTDANYVDIHLPILFILIRLLSSARIASCDTITIAGHFKLTQNRAIAEAVINLTVSIIAVNIIGIYGALLGTIAALLYRTNDMIIYCSKHILQRNPWFSYRHWIPNCFAFLALSILNKLINVDMSSYYKLFLFFIPYTIFVLTLYFFVALIFNGKVVRNLFIFLKIKSKKTNH